MMGILTVQLVKEDTFSLEKSDICQTWVGMETDMIYRAIRIHYSKNHDNMKLAKDFPENYLRKIIQLSFHIPKTPDKNRREFISTLFSKSAQDEFNKSKNEDKIEDKKKGLEEEGDSLKSDKSEIKPINEREFIELNFDLNTLDDPNTLDIEVKEVEDTAYELKMFNAYRTFIDDNPREIKRLVNAHRLTKIILQLKYPDMSWPIKLQSNLVRWVIFCTNWPDLVDEVLAELEKSDIEIEKGNMKTLGELINTLNNPPLRLREFITHMLVDDEFPSMDFKVSKSELKYLELATQISQKLDEPNESAPELKKGYQATLIDITSEHQP